LSDAARDAKFRDCARHGGARDGEALLARLHRLDGMADIRELTA
jgi:hypothetical protein